MSRNFDLLAEIEREKEFGSASERVGVLPDPPASQNTSALRDLDETQIVRLIRNIFFSNKGNAPRQVVFVGIDPENGSSSVCASAGHALALTTSKPVCVIDGNVHSAPLSQIFGAEKRNPFSGKFASVREQCAHIGGNLWLAGPHLMMDGRGSLLPVDELKHRLAQLDATFEYLLIDAPGTRVSNDAELLGQLADAAVLVVEADKTRRTAAAKAKDGLDAAGVRVLGTVLNNRSFPVPDKLYRLL